MSLNATKIKSMNISVRLNVISDAAFKVKSVDIEEVTYFKLCLFLATLMSFITEARFKILAILVYTDTILSANLQSALIYAAPAWFSYANKVCRDKLQSLQSQIL